MSDEVTKLIADNRGLIFAQIHKYKLHKDQEAESLGYEALYMAAATFDSSRGFKFSTYATVCIYNALGSYVRTKNKRRQLTVLSYHELLHNSDGDTAEQLDFLASAQDTEKEYLRDELRAAVKNAFDAQLSTVVNEKHRRIIGVWQENDFDITTSAIASEVGVSQSYVSQVLSNFKFLLRKRMEGYLD